IIAGDARRRRPSAPRLGRPRRPGQRAQGGPGMRRALARLALLLLALLLVAASLGEARSWSWLGVRIRDLSEQEMEEIATRHGIREGFGVVIVEVIADTPAAKAGLKSGDIVVAFGERPIVETRLLQR